MKRFSYIAMAALMTATLSIGAMAQAKSAPAKKADPCQSQKDAVKSAKKADKQAAQADLKKCQDANKMTPMKKKGGN